MARGRKRTFPAIARLSRASREIMEQAFIQGPGVRSVKSIVEEISEKTGERVDDNAVHRYREYWLSEERPFIDAQREAESMLALLKNNPTADVEELIKQRLQVAQLLAAKKFDEVDPVELGYLAATEKRIDVQRERNKILKKRTENDMEKISLLERTVELRERQWKHAVEKAESAAGEIEQIGKKHNMDAETLRKIREEIYGIVEAAA